MIIPVILSGGSGTRLWPISRKHYPKQFISLVNRSTLFQDTILRLPDAALSPLVICNDEHRFIVSEQLRLIDSSNNGIILEPIGKNTAPAIAIAAFHLLKQHNDPTLLVLSADHHIKNTKKFHTSILNAIKASDKNKMVALGIQPDRPETGYGYIEVNKSQKNKFYNINSFTEKPSLEIAKKYINSENYFWNSGIFIFKASVYLNELKKFEPKIFNACKKASFNMAMDLDFIRPNNEEFIKCPDKSIDYAVMERTQTGLVVPYNGNWSDIGSWDSLWSSQTKDVNNNAIYGDIFLSKVSNSYVYSSNRLVAVNDLSDLIVVDTPDALLVSSKKNSQNIKNIVLSISNSGRTESHDHRKVFRPWGYFDSVDCGNGYKVKRINVNPGSKLSLQKHQKRSEHWVVIKGVAKVTCGTKVFNLKENESTYIPKGMVHRLENLEDTQLEIIEIQTGEYLGEDDIIRLQDDYQRN